MYVVNTRSIEEAMNIFTQVFFFSFSFFGHKANITLLIRYHGFDDYNI